VEPRECKCRIPPIPTDDVLTLTWPRFQWAYCQSKRLERPRGGDSEESIRKILATLPKTLYETYDRTFLEIPEDDRNQARAILVFMAGFTMWWLPSLTDFGWWEGFGLSIGSDREVLNHGLLQAYILYDSESIPADQDLPALDDLCGCLIKEGVKWRCKESGDLTEEVNAVEFAHYTVREYLTSGYLAAHEDDALRLFALTTETIYLKHSARIIGFALDLQARFLVTGQSSDDLLRFPPPEAAFRLFNAFEAIWQVLLSLHEVWPTLDESMRHSLLSQYTTLFDSERSPITSRFIPLRPFLFGVSPRGLKDVHAFLGQ